MVVVGPLPPPQCRRPVAARAAPILCTGPATPPSQPRLPPRQVRPGGLKRPGRAPRTRPSLPPPAASPAAADVLLPLGLDFLTFLAATVLVVPVFKSAKVSPVLGFLFSGLVLGQLG